MSKIVAAIFMILVCSPFSQLALAEDPTNCLKISTEDLHPRQVTFLKGRLEKVYEEAGLCITWVDVNTKRATALLKSGELDGSIGRTTEALDDLVDHVFAIPTPLTSGNPSLLFLSNSSPDCSLENLRNIKLGYQMGVKWFELKFAPYEPIFIPLPNSRSAALLLERGRIDAYAFDRLTVQAVNKVLWEKNVQTRICPLQVVSLHHVLTNKHKDLKDRLNSVFAGLPKTVNYP